MTGFAVLLRKELSEAWRTRRLPAVLLLFAVRSAATPQSWRPRRTSRVGFAP